MSTLVVQGNASGTGIITVQGPNTNSNYTLSLPAETGAILTSASVATQADQETTTSTTTYVSPGRQQYHPSATKAWCTAQADATVVLSYNVSSVTDIGTGQIGVNFVTAFSSTNYSSQVTTCVAQGNLRVSNVDNGGTLTTSRCDFMCMDGSTTLRDPNIWTMSFFGDQ